MSETVASSGLMVPLLSKQPKNVVYEWNDLLYDQGSTVRINYEGTLAYTDIGGEVYGITFGFRDQLGDFDDLLQFNIGVDLNKVRPYNCVWYNGADSYMDDMTLEEFLKMTGQ